MFERPRREKREMGGSEARVTHICCWAEYEAEFLLRLEGDREYRREKHQSS
ncbi:hypothetical protein VMCG_10934 [Cytospora schulzeri]|uniref:Uncharacterized protein n=1 Tax=Cytospora schulzeri TaxID=448051 RepID=A0A423V7V2_9PEZI|nr:hypothetical protein VMCG_10934 [Valsa malicola]